MIGMHKDQRINALNRSGGFNQVNGIMILEWQDGMASVRVDLSADHLNPLGLVHGGLYASMLDVALAMCGSFRPEPDGLYPGLTLSLTTQYVSAMRLDAGFATARARRTGAGRSLFSPRARLSRRMNGWLRVRPVCSSPDGPQLPDL